MIPPPPCYHQPLHPPNFPTSSSTPPAGVSLDEARREAKDLAVRNVAMEKQIGELQSINNSASLGFAAVKQQYSRQAEEAHQTLAVVTQEKEAAEALAQNLATQLTEAMEQVGGCSRTSLHLLCIWCASYLPLPCIVLIATNAHNLAMHVHQTST
jgi:hypothetical protein